MYLHTLLARELESTDPLRKKVSLYVYTCVNEDTRTHVYIHTLLARELKSNDPLRKKMSFYVYTCENGDTHIHVYLFMNMNTHTYICIYLHTHTGLARELKSKDPMRKKVSFYVCSCENQDDAHYK